MFPYRTAIKWHRLPLYVSANSSHPRAEKRKNRNVFTTTTTITIIIIIITIKRNTTGSLRKNICCIRNLSQVARDMGPNIGPISQHWHNIGPILGQYHVFYQLSLPNCGNVNAFIANRSRRKRR